MNFPSSNKILFYKDEIFKFDEYFQEFRETDLENFTKREKYKHSLNSDEDNPEKNFPLLVNIDGNRKTGVIRFFNTEFLNFLNEGKNKINKFTRIFFETKNQIFVRQLSTLFEEKFCIMVPTANLISNNLYLIYPFQKLTWITLAGFVVYLALILKVIFKMTFSRGLKTAKEFITLAPFSREYSYKRNVFKYLPIELLIFTLLWIFGFIISNLYLSILSTYLTTFVCKGSLRTVEDIIAANLTVYFLEPREKRPVFFHNLYKNLEFKNLPNSYKNICKLDTNSAYAIPTTYWKFLEMCQSLMLRKRFELTEICAKPNYHFENFYFTSIFVPNEYVNDLEIFTLMVLQSGLLEIWETLSYFEIKKIGDFRYIRDNEDPREPLNLKFYEIAWGVLAFGLTLSWISFLIEKYRSVLESRKLVKK